MNSKLGRAVRIVPQQQRASRRLESFLDTAADIVAEVGYEAMTMTAIASRSGAAIGALYRYFPDKTAVASALLIRYVQQTDAHWSSLIDEAGSLTVEEIAEHLVTGMAKFAEEHPAYLPLINAPIKFVRKSSSRQNLRDHFSRAFLTKNPSMSAEQALLIANVVVEIMKGMIALYASTPQRDRVQVSIEFQRVLANYLSDILE